MEEKEQIKEMDDHQLMVLMAEKAVRNEKLKLIAVIAVAAIAAGIIISLIVVVPQIHGVLTNTNQILTDTSSIVSKVEQSADGISGIDFSGLNEAISRLQEAVDKLTELISITG